MSLTFTFFAILGILAIASGIVTISSKNPIVSAVSLVFHFFMLAGLYLTLNAQFIAITQILVYAGAIMILVVFVIMLLNLGNEEKFKEKINIRRVFACIIGVAFALQMSLAFLSVPFSSSMPESKAVSQGTVNAIGTELFTNYLFPFEAVSILLLVAILGAVVLAKKKID